MVSSNNLLNYLDWKIIFIVHTDASDKQLVPVISQNNKSIDLFPQIIINPQYNYTITDK